MKINETKLKKIIQEEMDMIEQPYFDHTDSEGGMAKSQLYRMAKYAMMLSKTTHSLSLGFKAKSPLQRNT